MGDALSHAVVPGVAVAYILGLPFALGAFVAGLLAAGTMAFIKAKSRIREDATIGIVFTAFFALGLVAHLAVSRAGRSEDHSSSATSSASPIRTSGRSS